MRLSFTKIKASAFTFLFCFSLIKVVYATDEDIVSDTSKTVPALSLAEKKREREIFLLEKARMKMHKKAYHEEKAYLKNFIRTLRLRSIKADCFLKAAEINADLIFNYANHYKKGSLKDLVMILSGGDQSILEKFSGFHSGLKGISKHPIKWKELSLDNRLEAAQQVLNTFHTHALEKVSTLEPSKLQRSSFPIPLLSITYSCFKAEEKERVSQLFTEIRDRICNPFPALVNLLDIYSFPNLSASPKITKEE